MVEVQYKENEKFYMSKSKKMIYFDKENHDIEETNTETFMCRSMSATNAYTEL